MSKVSQKLELDENNYVLKPCGIITISFKLKNSSGKEIIKLKTGRISLSLFDSMPNHKIKILHNDEKICEVKAKNGLHRITPNLKVKTQKIGYSHNIIKNEKVIGKIKRKKRLSVSSFKTINNKKEKVIEVESHMRGTKIRVKNKTSKELLLATIITVIYNQTKISGL